MDMLGILKICVRRWFVFLPLVLIGVIVADQLADDTKPEYESAVRVVAIAPAAEQPRVAEGKVQPVNPYLGSGGARLLLSTVGERLQTNSARTTVETGGGVDDYEMVIARTSDVLSFETISESRPAARQTSTTLGELAIAEAQVIQEEAGVQPELFLQVRLMYPVDLPTELPSAAMKVRIFGMGAGLAVAAAAAVLVEGLVIALRRWRTSRPGRSRKVAAPAPPPPPPPPPPHRGTDGDAPPPPHPVANGDLGATVRIGSVLAGPHHESDHRPRRPDSP
ncbi:MAG: hypothetical protein ACTH2Q_09265 [Propionibacteriaceae bacterium]